jgi:hypothetical protein
MLTAIVILTVLSLASIASSSAHPRRGHHRGPHHSPRFLIVQRLQAGLAGTPLEPYSYAIEKAGHQWNVSPFLIAAISGDESTFGEYACQGNAWGIASCGITFPDFATGAMYEAHLLRTGYLSHGARSVWDIARSYCPNCSEWPGNVAGFLQRFDASLYQLTYPTT